MSPEYYRLIHYTGIFLIFIGYGLLLARAVLQPDNVRVRKWGSMASGIGLLLILLGGFGMLAKLYSNAFPNWIILKLLIWVALGAMTAVINRKPELHKWSFGVVLFLGVLAAWTAVMKPF